MKPTRKPEDEGSLNPAKKPKLGGVGQGTSTKIKPEVPPIESLSELVENVVEAEDQNNEEKVVSLVLSALALLRETPLKPNSFVSLSLLAIAKKRHMVFQKRKILKALVSLLKKEASPQNLTQNSTMSLKPAFLLQGPSKTSSGVALPLLACNLLYAACKDISIWPHDFAMAYLEDAISDRVWVDHLEAKLFVDNLLTAFPGASPVEQRARTRTIDDEEEAEQEDLEGGLAAKGKAKDTKDDFSHAKPRFADPEIQGKIRTFAVNFVKDHLKKTSLESTQRNLARVSVLLAGYKEVAHDCSYQLEGWLNFPSTVRYAKEFMQRLSETVTTMEIEDRETLQSFLKVKPKTQVEPAYAECLRKLLANNPEYPLFAVNFLTTNELSGVRNPNFFKLIGIVLHSRSQETSRHLGFALQESLLTKNDVQTSVTRMVQQFATFADFDVPSFLQGLFQDSAKKIDPKIPPAQFCSWLIEIFHLGVSVLSSKETLTTLALGQALAWFRNFLTTAIVPVDAGFISTKHGPLLIDDSKLLLKRLFGLQDPKFSEADRTLYEKNSSSLPLSDDAWRNLLQCPLPQEFLFDLVDLLIRKGIALAAKPGFNPFPVSDVSLVDSILALALYRPPANIFVSGSDAATRFFVADSYWRCCVNLTVLACFNPASIGLAFWNNYPTLRMFMEVLITHRFVFPPLRDSGEDIQLDLQVSRLEKDEIIAFETKVASAFAGQLVLITPENAQFLTKYRLLRYDPRGPKRRPPPETFAVLQDLELVAKLGFKLCCSRNPDFLSQVMTESQKGSQVEFSLDWLTPILDSDPGTIVALPLPVLCDLFFQSHQKDENLADLLLGGQPKAKDLISPQTLLIYTRFLGHLYAPQLDREVEEAKHLHDILSSFLKPLISPFQGKRIVAHRALQSLLLCEESAVYSYLAQGVYPQRQRVISLQSRSASWLQRLPALLLFPQILSLVFDFLLRALPIETKPALLESYTHFLLELALNHNAGIKELVQALNAILVDRPILRKTLLSNPVVVSQFGLLFLRYLKSLQFSKLPSEVRIENDLQCVVGLVSGEYLAMERLLLESLLIFISSTNPAQELVDIFLSPQSVARVYENGIPTKTVFSIFPAANFMKSENVPLIRAVVSGLTIHQLAHLLELNGFPKTSVELLLAQLDACLSSEPGQHTSLEQGKAVGLLKRIEGFQKRYTTSAGLSAKQILSARSEIKEPARTRAEITEAMDVDVKVGTRSDSSPGSIPLDPLLGNLLTRLRENQFLSSTDEQAVVDRVSAKGEQTNHQIVPILHLAFLAIPSEPAKITLATKIAKSAPSQSTSVSHFLRVLEGKRSKEPKLAWSPEVNLQQQFEQFGASADLEERVSRTVLSGVASGSQQVSAITASLQQILTTYGGGAIGGLCMDWLEILNPSMIRLELAHGSDSLQPRREDFEFIFSATGSSLQLQSIKYHVLNTLLHNGSWLALELSLASLLQQASNTQRMVLDASVSLDFVAAYLRHPRSWSRQCDKVTALRILEDSDSLVYRPISPKEASGLVSLVVDEVAQAFGQGSQQKTVESRLPLVSYLVSQTRSMLKAISLMLYSQSFEGGLVAQATNPRAAASQYLLLLLYQLHPDLLAAFPNPDVIFQLAHSFSAPAGTLTRFAPFSEWTGRNELGLHRLLAKMFELSPDISKTKARGAYTVFRRYVTLHPSSVLRCLPIMAELLQGKANLNAAEFTQKHYPSLFHNVLNSIDALRPQIFEREYLPSLLKIMECFFVLLQNLRQFQKGLVGLVAKFSDFLCVFYGAVTDRAILSQHIEGNKDLLADTRQLYPDVRGLQTLEQMIKSKTKSFSIQSQGSYSEKEVSTIKLTLMAGKTKGMVTLANDLGTKEEGPILETLLDLGKSFSPVVLREFYLDYLRYLRSTNQKVREAAYHLVQRHATILPSDSKDTIIELLACIDSPDRDVSEDALVHAPEFLAYSGEYAEALLMRVFLKGAVNQLKKLCKFSLEQ